MDWVLVVSGNDAFQQRSMAMLGATTPAVGAVSDQSARRLVGSLRPGLVVVDGDDEYGKQFLISLRLLPRAARPHAVVVGEASVGFEAASSLEDALSGAAA
ncbi:MAG: hypothetical protein ABR548_04140 [Actinomycetota bacterium]|nr:hypothetical protein [Actinomycetota bacterium]